MTHKAFYFITTFFGFITSFIYLSIFISPDAGLIVVYLNYLIPPVFLLHAFTCIILILKKKPLYHLLNISLLIGIVLIGPLTVSIHFAPPDEASFSLMSYNVRRFREADGIKYSQELIDWVVNDPSTIKCFQEYSINREYDSLNVTQSLLENGYHNFHFSTEPPGYHHSPGLSIFTQFPIVGTGMIFKNKDSFNGAIYADIKVKKDTLRIYNVHLQSMMLRPEELKESFINLRWGSTKRKKQIQMILDHTSTCPHPFVLAGDFNEMPYNKNYITLSSHLNNSFEKAGLGFGFSFRLLPFLRIDHQFFSDRLTASYFRIIREIRISDHYPTKAFYVLKKR